MSNLVTLTVWVDAKKNPPKYKSYILEHLWTDQGVGYFYDDKWWWAGDAYERRLMEPQPKWYCRPENPDSNALTPEDFEVLLHVFDMAWESDVIPLTREDEEASHRLSRAIERLENVD